MPEIRKVNGLTQALVVSLIVMIGTGCASIIKGGGSQAIQFKSNPSGAKCDLSDFNTNNKLSSITTPAIVPLEKSNGYFKYAKYRINCSLDGKISQEAIIEGYANGWYIGGNLLFGGLIGYLIVDPATGAMWSLEPELVSVDFDEPSKSILKKQDVSDNSTAKANQ
jgi:hypothetical protein